MALASFPHWVRPMGNPWTKDGLWSRGCHWSPVYWRLYERDTKKVKNFNKSTYFVDEISCLKAPAFGDLVFPYLSLFRQNGISYFSSAFTLVRSAAKHALPGNDTDCKIISRDTVVVFAHDLRSHVSWSSTGLVTVIDVGNPFAGNTEIGKFQVAAVVKN